MTHGRADRTSRRRRGDAGWSCVSVLAAVLAAVVGVAVVQWVQAGPVGAATPKRPSRLLIVSVPTLTWADLDSGNAPNLTRFLDAAAVADLATRADRQPAALGAAYVTIGAGARSAGAAATDGEGLESDERFGAGSAAAAYRQRTGLSSHGEIVDLGIAQVAGANSQLLYGAAPGALGDVLAGAGYHRAVIANGDGSQPDATSAAASSYFRAAVGALMGSAGRTSDGAVGPELLRRDATAPYGVRLDSAAVESAFVRTWTDKSVSLVETSDLVRADRFAALATSAAKAELRASALRRSDRLFARLLAHVDLARDTVLVIAPVPPTGTRSVTVAGLRGPGVQPGLLRSATTRRGGFVTLADVAPTVLDQLGVARPTSMEGRPMRVEAGHGSALERRAALERADANGLLRDDLVNPVTATVLWTAMALAVACALLYVVLRRRFRRQPWFAALLQWVALASIGFVLATMPATLLDLGEHGGKAAYWFFVAGFALVFAAICRWAGRRRSLDALLVALGALLAVLVLDQFTGGHLEFNSVFGYSATVGIRFAGIGNQSSAILSTSAVLVAALLAGRIRAPWGVRFALVVLGVSFLALTPPLFGQDFGGTLASAPAFALLAWLLLGRRVTPKTVVVLVGILLVSGLGVGFLDLLRPSDQRTHVGRFFEQVGNEGFSGFSTVIERKGGENAATFSNGIYLLLIVVVLGAALLLWLRPPRPLALVLERTPTLRPAAWSLAVLLVLSYGLNDSGLAIPAIMLALIATCATFLVVDVMRGDPDRAGPTATNEPSSGRERSAAVPSA